MRSAHRSDRWLRENIEFEPVPYRAGESRVYQRVGAMVTWTRLRNLTGTPSTVAGWYCQRRAASRAILSYCGWTGTAIVADSTAPVASITTSMIPAAAIVTLPGNGGNDWRTTVGGVTSASMAV